MQLGEDLDSAKNYGNLSFFYERYIEMRNRWSLKKIADRESISFDSLLVRMKTV